MTEEQLTELLARVEAIEEAGPTYWDVDPEVAWHEPESQLGQLAEVYLEAGWEYCYHRGRVNFHYNVKANGNASWRAFWDKVSATNEDAHQRIEEIADNIQQSEFEFWWTEQAPEEIKELTGIKAEPYQCGRSGGYFNCSELEGNGSAMVKTAHWLDAAVEYYNGAEWGEYLAEQAIEEDTARQMARLASARPDRIEA